jgi:hypothetical protein
LAIKRRSKAGGGATWLGMETSAGVAFLLGAGGSHSSCLKLKDDPAILLVNAAK